MVLSGQMGDKQKAQARRARSKAGRAANSGCEACRYAWWSSSADDMVPQGLWSRASAPLSPSPPLLPTGPRGIWK